MYSLQLNTFSCQNISMIENLQTKTKPFATSFLVICMKMHPLKLRTSYKLLCHCHNMKFETVIIIFIVKVISHFWFTLLPFSFLNKYYIKLLTTLLKVYTIIVIILWNETLGLQFEWQWLYYWYLCTFERYHQLVWKSSTF